MEREPGANFPLWELLFAAPYGQHPMLLGGYRAANKTVADGLGRKMKAAVLAAGTDAARHGEIDDSGNQRRKYL